MVVFIDQKRILSTRTTELRRECAQRSDIVLAWDRREEALSNTFFPLPLFHEQVRVNGNEYRPTFASLNKKHAKATAATAALQAMGLVPKESMVNTTMFRSASHR